MESRLDKARREEQELIKRCWEKIRKYDEEKEFNDRG